MKLGLSNKVVLITGASQGIGLAIARRLAEEGMKIAVAARNAERLAKLAAEVVTQGGEALIFPVDLREESAPARFISSSITRGRRSAGISYRSLNRIGPMDTRSNSSAR